MRVDDRDSGRQPWWHAMVVRDDHVHTAGPRERDLRHARRAAVHGHDDRGTQRQRGLDRGERQAMPFVQTAWHVRLHGQPEATQCHGHDREAGEPIRIEVTEHQDALAAGPSQRQAFEQSVGVRQQRRVVEAIEWVGEPGSQPGRVDHAAAGQQAGHPLRDPQGPGIGRLFGRQSDRGRQDPTEARLYHVVRMPWAAAPRLYRRGPPPRSGGRASRSGRTRRGDAAVSTVLPEVPVHDDRARDEDRRVGPGDDADEQREDEVLDRGTAEQQ